MQPPAFLEVAIGEIEFQQDRLEAGRQVGVLQPFSEAPLPRLSGRAGHSSAPFASGSSNQKVAP